MITLSSIIEKFKDSFLDKHKTAILPRHRKALRDMKMCRKKHGPYLLAQCTNIECLQQTYIPHSCGNRNCPHCQNHEGQQWIENQLNKQLPVKYFLITFTLPEQLRDITWKTQKLIYSLFFICVKETLQTFTENDKKLQGTAGFTAVLHTNTRRGDYHPHIHVVIPAGSVNKKNQILAGKRWQVFV